MPAEVHFETLVDIYKRSTKLFGANQLFGEKHNGEWQWMTYAKFAEAVDDFRGGLAQLGVGPGDRVAVIANNRSEWAIGCYATYTLGASYVPMYEAQHDEEWEYILNDCGAKVVLVPSAEFVKRIEAFKDKLPALETLVRFDGSETEKHTLATLRRRGAETPTPIYEPKPEDLAGLIYTSGTTGKPKGVMLSHANIAKNVAAIHAVFPMAAEDRSLSFLPWAHSFGQVVELHGLYSMGASMGIAEAVDKIVDNLGEVQPTLLFAVPRIFNRIYDGLQKRMAAETAFKRKLFFHGIELAKQRANNTISGFGELKLKLIDKVVFAKVRARFGGRLKFAFSGSAALSKEVADFIDNIGIMVYEGYGLTETSPIFTVNYPGKRKIGSVGTAIPGTRIEIDHSHNPTDDPKQGEIICHGHNVMMGYYNLPEENEKVFTNSRGLRTGDLGRVDEDGFLYITGRVKEQYKLENGKYVAPAPLEESLKLSPYITQVMVHGANKPFNVAVIVPDMESLKKWASEKNISTTPTADLFKNPEVLALLRGEVNQYLKSAKGFERPSRFVLTAEEFTTENDMLSQSLKLKRRNVMAKYGDDLEAIYVHAAAEDKKKN
ncbi:MAG: long-chain fatty acid--CoA ligase [Deltaproteobacteria bacterium]|nr:long-chain fatty acid--CoA ligase [Deltaproteobacteria bacterium]